MFADEIARAIDTALVTDLDKISREIWRAHASGVLNDNQAQAAAEAVRARVLAKRTTPTAGFKTLPGKYPPRRPQRSPDRQASIERRRRLAASGPVPPALAAHFTTGQLAVLRIIGDQVAAHGVCGLHVDAIAARAGVCRTTVQNALREARRLGFILVQERRRRGMPSATNLVRIVNREWLTWRRLASGGGFKNSSTTNKTDSRKLESRDLLTVAAQRGVHHGLHQDAPQWPTRLQRLQRPPD